MKLSQALTTLMIMTVSVVAADPVFGQYSQFRGSCQVRGPYGAGCVEFYDGSWTDDQMVLMCRAVSARRAQPAIDYDHKCRPDAYGKLCTSQQLFSLAYIYTERMDELSCHGLLNGKLYQRPTTGW